VACGELAALSQHTLDEELARAKAQMRSSLLMGGESVMRVCEKMPRQWIQYGELKDTASQLSAIDNIDVTAIEKVTERLIKGDPVIAAIGDKRAKSIMPADEMAVLLK
jgi:predicted Zn-dependent peptidase